MENQTLADSLAPPAVAAGPGRSDGSGGSSGSGISRGATSPTTTARRRTPGRWRRIPRAGAPTTTRPPSQPFPVGTVKPGLIVVRVGSRDWIEAREREKQALRDEAEELEKKPDDQPGLSEEDQARWRVYKAKFPGYLRWLADGKVSFRPTPPPSDTLEEHLTADYMEELAAGREICPQARHFATLALNHYNSKKTHKFEMATVLLSKCFTELNGDTFVHVNFTAATKCDSASFATKRLFFAELMLIPELQADKSAEPMRVLDVCIIDGSCYGGCHEMKRDIKKSLRNNMDYERCHACSERIKHPRGDKFVAGHNSTRMPYYSTFPWIPQ